MIPITVRRGGMLYVGPVEMKAAGAPVRVLATRWCGDCRAARRVLDGAGVDYDWIDIDEDPAASEEVMRLNRGMRSVPTIIFSDGSVMVEPSRRALAARLAEAAGTTPAGTTCAADAGIPDCGTGPAGRIRFVLRELRSIFARQAAS